MLARTTKGTLVVGGGCGEGETGIATVAGPAVQEQTKDSRFAFASPAACTHQLMITHDVTQRRETRNDLTQRTPTKCSAGHK